MDICMRQTTLRTRPSSTYVKQYTKAALKYIKQYVAIFLAMPPADLDWKIDWPNKLDK